MFANLENRADVRVIEGRGSSSFALEPFESLAIFRKFLGQEFERHEPAEFGVLSLVHYAHATATQFLQDMVMGDLLADHGEKAVRCGASSAALTGKSTKARRLSSSSAADIVRLRQKDSHSTRLTRAAGKFLSFSTYSYAEILAMAFRRTYMHALEAPIGLPVHFR